MSNHSQLKCVGKVIISAKELSLHHESSSYGRDIWANRSLCSKVILVLTTEYSCWSAVDLSTYPPLCYLCNKSFI